MSACHKRAERLFQSFWSGCSRKTSVSIVAVGPSDDTFTVVIFTISLTVLATEILQNLAAIKIMESRLIFSVTDAGSLACGELVLKDEFNGKR